MNRLRRHLKAFTLIELLVVIVILGVLMAVALPTYLRQQSKAKDSNARQQLTYAYRAIRSALPEFSDQYPSTASIVSAIAQSEPELTVASGGCNVSTDDKHITVDSVLTNASKLALYTKSSSGTWWRLSAAASGAQTFTPLGTCVGPLSTATATATGNEITDATRAADTAGDGLLNDSSFGIYPPATNLMPNGGFESNLTGWSKTVAETWSLDSSTSKFGGSSASVTATSAGTTYGIAYFNMLTGSPLAQKSYSLNVWFKGIAGRTFQIQINEAGGASGTSAICVTYPVATGAWQDAQCEGTIVQPDRTSLYVLVQQSSSGTVLAGDSFNVDGVQVEQNGWPTAYIDTNGSTASKAAGEVDFPASSVSAAQGWYAIRVRLNFPSSQSMAINGGTNDPLVWWMSPGQASYVWLYAATNLLGFQTDAASYSGQQKAVTWNAGDVFTLIGYWTPATVGLSINGSNFLTGAMTAAVSGMDPTINVGDLGSSRWCNCDVLWFADGTGTLTNNDASTINGWGSNDPTSQDFPAAAQAKLAWAADTTTYVTGN